MTAFWPHALVALPAVLPINHFDCEFECAKLPIERQDLFAGLSHTFEVVQRSEWKRHEKAPEKDEFVVRISMFCPRCERYYLTSISPFALRDRWLCNPWSVHQWK